MRFCLVTLPPISTRGFIDSPVDNFPSSSLSFPFSESRVPILFYFDCCPFHEISFFFLGIRYTYPLLSTPLPPSLFLCTLKGGIFLFSSGVTPYLASGAIVALVTFISFFFSPLDNDKPFRPVP